MKTKEYQNLIYDNSIPEPNSGCWIWTGCVFSQRYSPYGAIRYEGKRYSAHRLSYVAFKGQIPSGMLVCHRCDISECVNPDHLFTGTVTNNNDDMVRKGRATWQRMVNGRRHHRTHYR